LTSSSLAFQDERHPRFFGCCATSFIMDEDPSSLLLTRSHFDFLQLAEEASKLFSARNPHKPGEEVKPWKKPRASSSSFKEEVEEQVDEGNYEVVDEGNYEVEEDEEEYKWWLPWHEEAEGSAATVECRQAEESDASFAKAPPPIAKAPPPVLPSSKARPAPPAKACPPVAAKACPPVPPWRNMQNVAPVTPPDDSVEYIAPAHVPPEQDSQAKPSLLVTKAKPRGPRKKECTPEQIAEYRREQAHAVFLGLDWDQRGPRPEFGPMPKTWRGGYWSENSRKWRGPRGGRQKEWRDQKYGKAKAKAKS
jgi:hypothetical protein